jgi:cyanophycinase
MFSRFLAALFVLLGVSFSCAQEVGPGKGALVVVGGGAKSDAIFERFVQLAGGGDGLIVFVPTAEERDPVDLEHCGGVSALRKAGARNLVMLHTRDRKVADSEAFTEPLRRATAVWLGGGRQWRFADAYLGTRAQREMAAVLERGGAIGGSSAGATIQGSFLVRGSPLGNTIMVAPDHLEGFGFLKNCAIDQHVGARGREQDLVPVIQERPQLLGIGLDEDTAIVVHGDTAEVVGAGIARFHDRTHAHWQELRAGHSFDLKQRAPLASFRIQLDTITQGYDGQYCWAQARAGAIPRAGQPPLVVVTANPLLLTGSDVYYALNEFRTEDLGKTWSGPKEHTDTLGRRDEPEGVVSAVCDFWPQWHAATGKLLGTGHTVRYRDNKVIPLPSRGTAYSVYDPQAQTWTAWATVAMPDGDHFYNAGAGCVQRVDLPNGEILLPIYFTPKGEKFHRVTVMRCAFDGAKLTHLEHGNELRLDTARGFAEPSLTRFRDRYYLTLRHDKAGYVCTSTDGLHYDEPRMWCWDDGTELGTYNTQAHWVTHGETLFLVYTRRGANNDHVFRNRAPLFIAEVDPEKLMVKRATERVLIPEHGARYGNFGVCEVNEHETWIVETEWMQRPPEEPVIPVNNRWGANARIYAARIFWDEAAGK